MEWVTTSTLLHELCDFENEAAWLGFVRRFRQPIVAFASGLGLSTVDAEDVAQETLLGFASGFRDGRYDRSKGRLNKWLFGIAYRQTMAHLRKRPLREDPLSVGSGAPLRPLDEPEATDLWERHWEAFLLGECLRQVREEFPNATFRAFELVVSEEQTASEAAEALGLNVKAIYNAKHRVLKRIRELRAELESVRA